MKSNIQYIFLSLSCILLLGSCTTTSKTNTFWTSGYKTEASAGTGKMQVISIHKSDDLNKEEWENFYTPIQGFEFEEGYMQKLEVKETPIEKSKVPADASSIRYELVKVVDKQKDTRTEVNGDWILATLNNSPINKMVKLPTLNIDLSKMQISANGGCNLLSGKIEAITTTSIKFSPLISTLKACIEPNIENEFSIALNNIKSYEVKNSTLTFMNDKGEKILSFLKGEIKTAETPYQLHDIWAVTKINGIAINTANPIPDMEINLNTMKIMGKDGCNNYNGTIDHISDKKIKFGPIATTRMMCENMEHSNLFNTAITKVNSYQLNGLQLMLLDENGKEIITLKKVD